VLHFFSDASVNPVCQPDGRPLFSDVRVRFCEASMKYRVTWAGAILFLPLIGALAGCSESSAESGREQPTATLVVVAPPLEQSVTDFYEFTGRTDAAESVEIRA